MEAHTMKTVTRILLALVLAAVLAWLVADLAVAQPAVMPPSKEGAIPDPAPPQIDGPWRVASPFAWGFVAWRKSGARLGGQLRDTQEECEEALDGYRDAQPDAFFSPCIEVRAEPRTL